MGVVIYVDHDLSACAYMQSVIDKAFEFFSCTNARDALQFLEHRGEEVDAVITDARMSSITDRQLVRTVATQWPNVARILTISHADLESLCKYVNERHIDCVIQNPSELDDVTDLINDCVMQKKLSARPIDFQTVENNLQQAVVRAELAAASLLQNASDDSSHEIARKPSGINHNTANAVFEEISRLRQSIDQVTSSFSFKLGFIDTDAANLGDCCEHALRQLKDRSLDVTRITLECDDNLSIKADGELLAAALSQLVANALFATRDAQDPSINISAVRSGRDAIVQITDNGNWNNTETISTILKDLEFIGKNELNLGMNIAIWLLRENGGKLQFLPKQPFGMTAAITFPLLLQ